MLITIEEGEYPDTLEQGMRVLLFTSDGEELWRFNTEENARGGWGRGISRFGNYVIVSSRVWPSSYPRDRRSTYLLSNNGELLMKYENVSSSLICFSSSDKYALFHSPHEGAFLLDLPSGEVLLKYGRKGGFHQANSLDIAEDAKIFGLASSSAVSLIGFDGSKVWSQSFPADGGKSTLSLSDDGKQLAAQIGTKILIYQQEE